MTLEEMQRTLTYLLDRQSIYDAIANYCRGVDRLDMDLLRSVYHTDATDDHGMFVGNRDEFAAWVKEMHSAHHQSTQHLIANQVVEIDGTVAHAETYFIFSGMNSEGAPFTSTGGRYIDRLEKRDGKWGIVARNCVKDWVAPSINSIKLASTPEGQANYGFLKPHEVATAASSPSSTRDHSDPSYQRPLRIPAERTARYKSLKAAEIRGTNPAPKPSPIEG